MKMKLRSCSILWILSVAVVHLAGCASSIPLSEAQLPRDGWQTRIDATQKEVESEASNTNAMAGGGGLLGVLIAHGIDSTRNSRAQDALVPIRNLLIEYPLMDRFVELIRASDIPAELTTNAQLNVSHELPDNAPQPESMSLVPRVIFTNRLSALMVRLHFTEIGRAKDGDPEATGVHQTYEFAWPIEEPSSGDYREDYSDVWVAKGREEMISLIELGMNETVAMFSQHLKQPHLQLSERKYRIPNYNRLQPLPKLKLWQDRGELFWLAKKPESHTIYGSIAPLVGPKIR